ncbi:Hypothetical predicted protein [Mytilus galloprovincialis]|uniref:Uncharacterized protein n=1 Tax=Mytilus galloprovincialis TaxID=29158 RepID=A0A8B6H566_MYTGA|nr:Hypothetical predicted protein [Mytilus galloprovincialis]
MVPIIIICSLILYSLTGIDTCSHLDTCTHQLEEFFNVTRENNNIAVMIPLCLSIVGSRSKLQNCERNAVVKCLFGGHEPEYSAYKALKITARNKCLQDCPTMDDVKICQDLIKYDTIQTSGYSQFCSNYTNIKTTCVDTKLKTCSFRDELFLSGLSGDVKRIVQTICQSGCSSIDKTKQIIDTCNSKFTTSSGNDFADCNVYKQYISCIEKESPCPQFSQVAKYSKPTLSEAQARCEPATTTKVLSTAAALTTVDGAISSITNDKITAMDTTDSLNHNTNSIESTNPLPTPLPTPALPTPSLPTPLPTKRSSVGTKSANKDQQYSGKINTTMIQKFISIL